MCEIKLEIKDYYVLLNLHKALLEAKFHLEPDNALVCSSPIIANLCDEIVDILEKMRGMHDKKCIGEWENWRKLASQDFFRQRAIKNAVLNDRWLDMSYKEKVQVTKNLISPFKATEKEVEDFIKEVQNTSTERNSIKEENKEITYKGIQILKILKELDYILISLHHQGSYYAERDKSDYEYEKETTAFIYNSRVCERLANIRRILTEQVDTAVGDDDMDDIERICQDIPYWRKPGDFTEEMWIDEELFGDRILMAGGYGVCVFSLEVLQDFLKRKKVKTKKLLDKFQKNKELYLDMRKEGIWVPFVPMDAADYVIKLEGYNAPFDEEWEKKLEYGGFNIEIKDAFWISSIGSFENFREEEYTGAEGTYEAQSGVKYYYDANERCYDMPGQEIVYKGFGGYCTWGKSL